MKDKQEENIKTMDLCGTCLVLMKRNKKIDFC
jgi:hypothetical protein